MRVRRAVEGDLVRTYRGKDYLLRAGELGLICADARGRDCGWLLYELCEPGDGPRPWYAAPYVFLYSVYVEPRLRGRGIFTRMTGRLRRLHPATPVVGMAVDSTGAVGRFFDRCLRMPGRRPVERLTRA